MDRYHLGVQEHSLQVLLPCGAHKSVPLHIALASETLRVCVQDCQEDAEGVPQCFPVGLLESWLECVAVTEKRDPAAASAGHYAGTPTEILLQYLKVRSCAAGVCRSCAGASEQAECSSRAGLSATEAATAQYRPFSTHEALFQADVRLLCIHKCIVPAARSFDALCL